MNASNSAPPYGSHAPGLMTLPLRIVTWLGLARGKVSKLLHKVWLLVHGSVVDAEVRGVKYRLNLQDNTTDMKILVSSPSFMKQPKSLPSPNTARGCLLSILERTQVTTPCKWHCVDVLP